MAAAAVAVAVGPAPAAHAQIGGATTESGMIVVADNRNERIQVFYPDGTFAFKFSGQADSIDVGPDGTIVTIKRSYGHYVYHPNGTFASHLGGVLEGSVAVLWPPLPLMVGSWWLTIRDLTPFSTAAPRCSALTGRSSLCLISALAVNT